MSSEFRSRSSGSRASTGTISQFRTWVIINHRKSASSILEALASNVGGIPEVVEHGVTGYLAPVGDLDQMSSYCIELLSNCSRKEAFARAAKERAATVFSYRKIVPQYEAIYERVLKYS